MQFSDYQHRYHTIQLNRSTSGVLELVMHTRGGVAKWGTSTKSLHAELGQCFADIARDRDNKVVIITGSGAAFCNERDMEERPHEASLSAMWERIYEEGMTLMENLLAIPVPVIGAVNGPATIHAELGVLSDIVLAADHAEFADVSHSVHGVVPGDGVHTVWPMLLGPNRGRYFLLTGERIGAVEAKQLGVVAEVMPLSQLMPRARELAEGLAVHPVRFLRHTRAVLIRQLRKRMADELGFGLGSEALATLTV
jgi:enoyl-CoA hydratase/carnithine racemase